MKLKLFGNPWETPEFIQLNRLPARATLRPYPTLAQAKKDKDSPWLQSLDGEWDFRLYKRPDDVPQGAIAMKSPGGKWSSVQVPGNWTVQGHDKPHYTNVQMPFKNDPPRVPQNNPTGVYRRNFRIPQDWRKRRTVLQVGGAESIHIVYLNGELVGMGKDSRLPSEYDLTDHLKTGTNQLAIVVIRWSDASYLEDQDHWWMAGIHRSVFLYSTAHDYIADVFAKAGLDDGFRNGMLEIDVRVGCTRDPQRDFKLRASLFDAKGKMVIRKPLEKPVSGSFRMDSYTGSLRARIPGVAAWSAEQPSLYRLVVSLHESSGKLIEATSTRIGFREVRLEHGLLKINGQAVKMKGVNRHDHHPRFGKHVPVDTMLEDIRLLKQFNFNAIRTAHYPNDSRWYDLCDEYGIYVIDEANIENHANYSELCHDPRWLPAYQARVQRMVLRDRNHPCIFAWSLGNESGNGEHHDACADWIRMNDPTRLVHHEGAVKSEWGQGPTELGFGGERNNDVVNPMYPHLDWIRKWVKEKQDTGRPFIACEYSHAMGNSNGGLSEYWDLFWKHENLQGGFIWDWVDQGLEAKDKQGRHYWKFGGDFGDDPTDYNFCINGMIWPDRTPHPAMWEFKKLVQPIDVKAIDVNNGRLRLANRDWFRPLNWLEGRWKLEINGRAIQHGTLPPLRAAPGKAQDLKLELTKRELAPGDEAILRLSFQTRASEPWCSKGHEVAWEEFKISSPGRRKKKAAKPAPSGMLALRDQAGSWAIRSTTSAFIVKIDKQRGEISSRNTDGATLILRGPVFSIHRAWLDNDGVRLRDEIGDWKALGRWRRNGVDRIRLSKSEISFSHHGSRAVLTRNEIHTCPASRAGVQMSLRNTLHADGRIDFDATFEVDEAIRDLPRLGIWFDIGPGLTNLEWFGPGPRESYIDRKRGCPTSRWRSSVADQYVPYILPQEHGNHVDLRWLALSGSRGGLVLRGPGLLSANATHLPHEELVRTRHSCDVRPRPQVRLYVDVMQRGLGTASCGPDTLEKHQLGPGPHRLRFSLIPFGPDQDPGKM